MPKELCTCGRLVDRVKNCKCRSGGHRTGTTTQRGYGYDHEKASKRYRKEKPICEACLFENILTAKPSEQMHHIESIATAPKLRMVRSNWLALCKKHHDELETNPIRCREIKTWSDQHYETITTRR